MTDWKKVNYLRKGQSFNYDYQIELPEPLASWDVYDYWEHQRTRHMAKTLKKDDLMIDIGAEYGWQTAVYQKMCKLIIVEPNVDYFNNIRQIWEKNCDSKPEAIYVGLMSDKDLNNPELLTDWFDGTGELVTGLKYRYIGKDKGLPQMKVDTLVKKLKKTPTAITMDIEGAELLVLRGAEKLLNKGIKVWVSVHPDLAEKTYDIKPNEIHDYLKSLGYKGKLLGTDHEEHWYYEKKQKESDK